MTEDRPYRVVIASEHVFKARKKAGLWRTFDRSLKWRIGVVIVSVEFNDAFATEYQFVKDQKVKDGSGSVAGAGIQGGGAEPETYPEAGTTRPFSKTPVNDWATALEQAKSLPLAEAMGSSECTIEADGYPLSDYFGSGGKVPYLPSGGGGRAFANRMDVVYLGRKPVRRIGEAFYQHAIEEIIHAEHTNQ